MKIQKQIEVRLTKNVQTSSLHVVQFDKGIQLVFNILDFDLPSGTTAIFYALKKSGKFVYQEDGITVDTNTVTVDLENQALTECGNVRYQLRFTNGEDTISTFRGSMTVDPSLADEDAEESKTVVTNFEALTQEKIAEMEAAMEEFIAQAQEMIADSGAKTLATIPEDYTEMEQDVNTLFDSMANAIKVTRSGAVVCADDVSPVKHSPVVTVRGKNLFDISKIETGTSLTNNRDGTLTVEANAYHVTTGKKLSELCPRLSVGDVCVLSFENQSPTSKFFHLSITGTWFPNNAKTITREMLNSTVAVYGCHPNDETYGSENVISDIQVEFGETATEYTPYIDPETVTVARHGKNLLNPSNIGGHVAYNATTDLYTISTTGSRSIHTLPVPVPKGTECTIRVEVISGKITNPATSGQAAVIGGYHTGDNGNSWQCAASFPTGESVNLAGKVITATATVTETVTDIYFFFYASAVTIDTPIVCKVQFEIGGTATEHEVYKEEQILTPNEDGTVDLITTTSPNMTILTDTEGVIVECEYTVSTETFVRKLISTVATKSTEITLYADQWADEGSCYSQVVTMNCVTANSKIDLQPSPEQLAEFVNDEISLVAGNENGTITVYAIGNKPGEDVTLQTMITEVIAV